MAIALESVTRSLPGGNSSTVMERENRIYAPKLPFVSIIPNGLCGDKAILIKGLVHGKQSSFEVNLCCGLQVDGLHRDDIALHINPRFSADYKVVVNSLLDDSWGPEQRYKNPLSKGQPFFILITVLPHAFKIAINHDLCIEYSHRTPLEQIKIIQIKGAALVDAVEYINSVGSHSLNGSTNNIDEQQLFVKYMQPLPLCESISYGADYPTVRFTLTFANNPRRVHFDFVAGEDIALHNDIRFDEKAIVRNSLRRGNWENEERTLVKFPFRAGCSYEFEIYCEPCRFVVRIGGWHAYNFSHRMNPGSIDRLRIDGSGRLLKVSF